MEPGIKEVGQDPVIRDSDLGQRRTKNPWERDTSKVSLKCKHGVLLDYHRSPSLSSSSVTHLLDWGSSIHLWSGHSQRQK